MRQVVSPITICGAGFYVPEEAVTNKDYEKMYGVDSDWIEAACGIKTRHKAAPWEYSSDMGTMAAKRAMASAGVKPEEIDLIIVATASPDYLSPATSCIIQHALGAKNAVAFDMNVACMGFIWAFTTAAQYLSHGTFKTVLVIAAEVSTKGADYDNKDTFILLGDGAGACVLRKSTDGKSGIIASHYGCDGGGWDKATLFGGGAKTFMKQPDKSFCFSMKGSDIYKFAVRSIPDTIRTIMEKGDIAEDEISMIIPHQANLRILKAAEKRLGFKKDKFFIDIDKYGNSGAATIAIALGDAFSRGMIKKGDIIVPVGFGAGLSWGGFALRY